MSIQRHLPNFLTCCNLFFGCLSIAMVANAEINWACYCIFIAMIFDFSDGFAARMLKAYSEFGKQLDSLADVVSFGVAPGLIIFYLSFRNSEENSLQEYLSFCTLLIPVLAALRLAKFNIDERQRDSFIGLPTPANALFLSSLPLVLDEKGYDFLQNPWFLIAVSLLISALMVTPVKLFTLKFKDYSWRNNKPRYIIIALSIILFLTCGFFALPLVIIFYVGYSLAFMR